MAFLWLFNSSHKVSTSLLGKDELTIKENLKLELRNAYLKFDGRGLSSNLTSSLGVLALGSFSLLKGSNRDVL